MRVIQAEMPGANLIVFRETAETVSGQELARRLRGACSKLTCLNPGSILDALLIAGEIECALRDQGWMTAGKAQEITDIVSAVFVESKFQEEERLKFLVAEVTRDLPESVRISHPEGFAYYGLHPGDFADAVSSMDAGAPVAVIGIRSMGTTLSAVARAALRKRHVRASRITVRPTGHPYDRRTELCEQQRAWVREQRHHGTKFLVVDEGPGLSGSSFLSVAECLVREGVGADSITLIGTRDVDPEQLCAADASSRWNRFGWRRVSSRISQRFKGSISLSSGAWRELFLSDRAEHPPYWPEMDAAKYWSADRTRIFKFEGLGAMGREVRERSSIIREAGFGPRVEDAADGMSSYDFIPGRALSGSDLSTAILDRIAEYCAFRASEFRTRRVADGQIQEMVRFNFKQETGRDCPLALESFGTDCPVITDGRMSPHEWIESINGNLIKVDASRHGDDHFLPGPADIAWDLAGAVVEWNMEHNAERYLLERFRKTSGMTPENVTAFRLAYSLWRASYCKMALMGTGVESEKPNLQKAYRFYRARVDDSVRQLETAGAI